MIHNRAQGWCWRSHSCKEVINCQWRSAGGQNYFRGNKGSKEIVSNLYKSTLYNIFGCNMKLAEQWKKANLFAFYTRTPLDPTVRKKQPSTSSSSHQRSHNTDSLLQYPCHDQNDTTCLRSQGKDENNTRKRCRNQVHTMLLLLLLRLHLYK